MEVVKTKQNNEFKIEEKMDYLKLSDNLFAVDFNMKVVGDASKLRFVDIKEKSFSGFLNNEDFELLMNGREIPNKSLSWSLCNEETMNKRLSLSRSGFLAELDKNLEKPNVSAKKIINNPDLIKDLYHVESLNIKKINNVSLNLPIAVFNRIPSLKKLIIDSYTIADNIAAILKENDQVKKQDESGELLRINNGKDLSEKIFFIPTQEQFNLMIKICDELKLEYSNENFKSIIFTFDMLNLKNKNFMEVKIEEDKIKNKKEVFFMGNNYPKHFILGSLDYDTYKNISWYALKDDLENKLPVNEHDSLKNKI